MASIPEEAVYSAAEAIGEFNAKAIGGTCVPIKDLTDVDREHALGEARAALEAAVPHMLAGATEDREEVEARVKSIVQDVAMTVDYTERLHTAVQEIMAITMPRPTP